MSDIKHQAPGSGQALRWGVLGGATIARRCVIPAIVGSGNGTPAAIASRDATRAETLAAEFGFARAYGSYNELIQDPHVDAVYIPLPNHLHAEWAIKAAQAGKHVLVEKPIACNVAEAAAMFAAARDSGVLLMEALMYRFQTRTKQIKALLDGGAIGALRGVQAAFTFLHPDPQNHRMRPEFGGGALLDVGCYAVSLACYMFAAAPVAVSANAIFAPSGIDLFVGGRLRFADGRTAQIEAGFDRALQQRYSVIGDAGALELPHDAFIPWGERAEYTIRAVDSPQGRSATTANPDQYRLMVSAFADAILQSAPPPISAAESIRTMRVLDSLARAARSGCEERLDIANLE
ncbi:MAG: Gfo/Idh/MocA family oxidoreductase [Oscillochloris sp.]|nr:Gfo/Idh/MocA family oxidoreductase [Oscillochloris sp.]